MKKKIYLVARHFIENSGSYAGMIEKFSKYVNSKGYDVTILCSQLPGLKKIEKLNYARIVRFYVPKINFPLLGMNLQYIFLARGIKQYFRNNSPNKDDLIIVNTRAALGLKGLNYFLRMGQPSLTFLKNMEIAKKRVSMVTRIFRYIHHKFQFHLEKKCVKNAKGFIFPSSQTRKHIMKYYNGKNKPHFIPFSGVNYFGLQNGKKINFAGKKIIFISAGTEKVRKGIIYLEEILPIIFSKYKDVNLIHIGEKFEWNIPNKYKKQIISVGKVKWDEMKNYYISGDMLIFASLQEGFPNTILEAMASGCPIITSDIDGIKEYIQHMKEGYIFKRGDIKDMIEGVLYMLCNPQNAKEMANNAKLNAKKLDYLVFSERLLEFLENVNDNKIKSTNLLNEN